MLAKSCQKVDDAYSELGAGYSSIFNPISRAIKAVFGNSFLT